MFTRRHSDKFVVQICILLFCIGGCFARTPEFLFLTKNTTPRIIHTRVTIAPVISFYKVNAHHASSPHQKMSGLVSVKGELRLNQQHTAFFQFGVEYMLHGLTFNSYYFKPDSIQLYTGEMNYKYSLDIQEIDIPLQLKLSLTRENNSLHSPYLMIGYHFRTLISGHLTVTQNGQAVDSRKENLTFKNPLITPKNNPFVSATIGYQRNWPNSAHNCLYVELTYRMGFSQYLLKDTFAPSSLYINGNHLSLGLGVKF